MANYRVIAEWSLPNGSVAQNVFHARVINGETADQDDLVDDLKTTIIDILTPWLSSLVTQLILTAIRVYVLDVVTGLVTPVGVGVASAAGTLTGDALPAGVAVKINQYVAGRSRPFGVYLPSPAETQNTANGRISSTAQTNALLVAVNNSQNTVMPTTGLVYRPLGYSRASANTYELVGANNEVDITFDYQRRRKVGVGI